MTTSVFEDLRAMHDKFGFHDWLKSATAFEKRKMLELRMNMAMEELHETRQAVSVGDCEEIVDGLIDMIVFNVGTLDLLGVDGQKAWDAIQNANMSKVRGVKAGRPNPLRLPDLMKPEGWKAPSHEGNHGNTSDFVDHL